MREEFISRNIADKSPLPTYPTFRAILANTTGGTYTNSTTFHDALITDLDANEKVLNDSFAVLVAKDLKVSV